MRRVYFVAILSLLLLSGCAGSSPSLPEPSTTDEVPVAPVANVEPAPSQAPQKAILNVCLRDPSNADYWRNARVNVWGAPGGRVVATLPPCSSLELTVLGNQTSGNDLYYQVQYGTTVGWVPKSLLFG